MANVESRGRLKRYRPYKFAVASIVFCAWAILFQENATAESAEHCKEGLFACARQTPMSSLHFGLWIFGNELRNALMEGQIFNPQTRIRSRIGTPEGIDTLQIVVIDSGLKCQELVRFLTNYIGHWGRMETIYPSEENVRTWTSEGADAHIVRSACVKVAGYVAPPDFGDISDRDLSELCTAIKIQILPIEKPETKAFSKACVVPLNDW
jgi:hypothetical protein